MPRLDWIDEAAYELIGDELGALARRTSSTAHPALRHDRCEAPPSCSVDRARVLRLVASPCEPPAPWRAEALMLCDGSELAPATSALACSEGARHSPSQTLGATGLAGRAQLLVPVARKELERTAATGLSHDQSRAILRAVDSLRSNRGDTKSGRGWSPRSHLKNRTSCSLCRTSRAIWPLLRCQDSGRGATRRVRKPDPKRCRIARVSAKN